MQLGYVFNSGPASTRRDVIKWPGGPVHKLLRHPHPSTQSGDMGKFPPQNKKVKSPPFLLLSQCRTGCNQTGMEVRFALSPTRTFLASPEATVSSPAEISSPPYESLTLSSSKQPFRGRKHYH